MTERSAIRIAHHNSVRVEEPATYRVKTGKVSVSDVNGTAVYGPDEQFSIPSVGGATLFCLEQLIAYEVA